MRGWGLEYIIGSVVFVYIFGLLCDLHVYLI
jgi:hypothetical protein